MSNAARDSCKTCYSPTSVLRSKNNSRHPPISVSVPKCGVHPVWMINRTNLAFLPLPRNNIGIRTIVVFPIPGPPCRFKGLEILVPGQGPDIPEAYRTSPKHQNNTMLHFQRNL
eukprot:5009235-Pyramimonas_sp.AAC.1